jgi:hypothetical protein
MADIKESEVRFLRNFDDKLSEKKGDTCLRCDELSFELQKAKLEILSYEKIVKLLLEEISNKELHTQSSLVKQKTPTMSNFKFK